MINKIEDAAISQAHTNGYDDYTHLGYDCPCPYDLESKEALYWHMGFNDAVSDELSSSWDDHE
ncbi:MAG: hypothetical protein EOO06_00905 [Chitinophagaceae bacterium]|nr:MAG: hypothetical protein EOO06_00905 [Chitinophagaceae bacterium]